MGVLQRNALNDAARVDVGGARCKEEARQQPLDCRPLLYLRLHLRSAISCVTRWAPLLGNSL